MKRMIPDWEKQGVVIAWPTCLSKYVGKKNNLLPFYRQLLKIFMDHSVPTFVLVSTQKDIEDIRVSHGHQPHLRVVYIPGLCDIWLRDCSPWVVNDEGVRTYWQPGYDPDYLKKEHFRAAMGPVMESFARSYLSEDSILSSVFSQFKGNLECDSKTFYWEGGNATYNASGTLIATNHILKANNVTHAQVSAMVQKDLGVDSLMLIDSEPGDILHHSDGTLRFWDDQTILLSDLTNLTDSRLTPYQKNKYKDFFSKLENLLKAKGYEFIPIPVGPFHDGEWLDGAPSARGCYINYLHMKDLVILPVFGNQEQDLLAVQAFESLNDRFYSGKKKLVSLDSSVLADFGGVLNCVTWTV